MTQSDFVDLLPLLEQHDSKAFSILYDHYAGVLYGLLFRLVKSEGEAENLLQDTFVKIWKKIADYESSKASFYTWITTIARNTAIDYLRSGKNKQRMKIQSIDEYVYIKESENPSSNLEHNDLRNQVKKLEPKYQEVIELVYFMGYTQQEASEHLQLQLGTVKTRCRFAIKELRKWMPE